MHVNSCCASNICPARGSHGQIARDAPPFPRSSLAPRNPSPRGSHALPMVERPNPSLHHPHQRLRLCSSNPAVAMEAPYHRNSMDRVQDISSDPEIQREHHATRHRRSRPSTSLHGTRGAVAHPAVHSEPYGWSRFSCILQPRLGCIKAASPDRLPPPPSPTFSVSPLLSEGG